MKASLILGFVACGLIGLTACEKEPGSTGSATDKLKSAADGAAGAVGDAAEKAKEAAKGVADEATKLAEEAKAKFVTGAEEQLGSFKTQITELRAKADKAAEPVKAVVAPLLTEAETQLSGLAGAFDKLKTSGLSDWEGISKELGAGLDKLKTLLADIASKLG